jgi:hypothetical protein
MSNPSGPDQPDEATEPAAEATDETDETQLPDDETNQPAERRFTAPSAFDAGLTQKIDTPADPATEVMPVPRMDGEPAGMAAGTATTEPMAQQKSVAPQLIPPRIEPVKPPRDRRSWGWVVALLLVIAALVAVAILGTLLLTRGSTPKMSQQDMVRSTTQNFDVAVQNGDLAARGFDLQFRDDQWKICQAPDA